jgi:hypothetical protein
MFQNFSNLPQFDTGDIISVDLQLTNDQHDVTGFGDAESLAGNCR